jgi:hypothetical protein
LLLKIQFLEIIKFTSGSGIPPVTAARFSKVLSDQNLITLIEALVDRRFGLYAFEPLLELVHM